MIEKSGKLAGLPGTDSGLRPGDFTLGSVESRAAARAILLKRDEGRYACEKCLKSLLGSMPTPKDPDAHWDSARGVYRNLHHSPKEHAELGLSIEKVMLSDDTPMLFDPTEPRNVMTQAEMQKAQSILDRMQAIDVPDDDADDAD